MQQNVSAIILILQKFKKMMDHVEQVQYKKTSFGPEEGKTEQNMMFRKKNDQISQVRGVLDSQTMSKKEFKTFEQIQKQELEKLENSQSKSIMAINRQKLQQVKGREKALKDTDIKRVQGNYSMIPTGSDVVTKA